MEWEKQKFLIEMELKKLEIRKENFLKRVSFLQTLILITASATIGTFYKNGLTSWVGSGIVMLFLFSVDLLRYYKKIDSLENIVDELKVLLVEREK